MNYLQNKWEPRLTEHRSSAKIGMGLTIRDNKAEGVRLIDNLLQTEINFSRFGYFIVHTEVSESD